MYRQILLGMVGLAVLAFAVLAGPAAPADNKDADEHGHGAFAKCARACADCALECESCLAHCERLVVEGKKDHAETMRTCDDCGDFCALAARIVGRQGPMSATACEGCARACDACGAACEKFPDDEHMKRCATACRDCAKACRDMLEHVKH